MWLDLDSAFVPTPRIDFCEPRNGSHPAVDRSEPTEAIPLPPRIDVVNGCVLESGGHRAKIRSTDEHGKLRKTRRKCG
jgi:hypothetical protein